MKNAVTIHEVSRRAGVSLSTVSRVLNDNANVNADMRERVLRAVEDLGYRPNLAAQALKTSRSRMIVFLIPEISNPYYTETYRGIHSVAQQRGYVTLIYEADDVDAAVHSILMRGADGVLIDAVFGNESKELLLAAEIPFVQTNVPARRNLNDNIVCVDVYGATLEVLEYLHSMGHTRIGLIDSRTCEGQMDERERAFRDHATSRGIVDSDRFIAKTVVVATDKYSGGYAGMRELIERNVGITAVITLNDMVSVGAIAGARSMGRSVPADISLVGFDDADIARYITPPLTTVRIPTFRQGEIAAGMLFDLIEHPDEPLRSVQIPTELVFRESVRRITQ